MLGTNLMQKRLWLILSIAALAAVAAPIVWWVGWSTSSGRDDIPSPTDIRENAYVSEQRCAECHSDQAADHRTSGHASTFYETAEFEPARWLDGQTFQDPERPYSYIYRFDEQRGLSVSIDGPSDRASFDLTYALGSGKNAVTFLSLVPDRFGDTLGMEHRVSLYSREGGWDLDITPGQRGEVPQQEIEFFGKIVRGDTLTSCVDCHTSQAEIVRQDIENLHPHVGCQSCHGPGRAHVTAMESDLPDEYSQITGQSAREEVDVCGKCHRLTPAASDVNISPDEIKIVRFQSVGLPQSRCFSESKGRLTCTTCHDPHNGVSRDVAHYVERCLKCHSEDEQTLCPVSPRENCIQCHMPPIDIHRGIEFHDHWIRVRTNK